MLSFCFSLRSTVTGELALCHLTVYSSYSIWTAETQAIQAVPLKLHKTPINTVHNMESLVVMRSKLHSTLQPLSCCYYTQYACQPDHKKHIIRYLSLTTIKTSHRVTPNSHTKLSQYQKYKINMFSKNLRSLK